MWFLGESSSVEGSGCCEGGDDVEDEFCFFVGLEWVNGDEE